MWTRRSRLNYERQSLWFKLGTGLEREMMPPGTSIKWPQIFTDNERRKLRNINFVMLKIKTINTPSERDVFQVRFVARWQILGHGKTFSVCNYPWNCARRLRSRWREFVTIPASGFRTFFFSRFPTEAKPMKAWRKKPSRWKQQIDFLIFFLLAE